MPRKHVIAQLVFMKLLGKMKVSLRYKLMVKTVSIAKLVTLKILSKTSHGLHLKVAAAQAIQICN